MNDVLWITLAKKYVLQIEYHFWYYSGIIYYCNLFMVQVTGWSVRKKKKFIVCALSTFFQWRKSLRWRHDIQHNNTQHNDIQHNDTQHNDIQQNDSQHNDTRDNSKLNKTFSITTFSIMIFSIMTFSIMTFSITTFSVMTISITVN
jgi:hypothetical protein